MQLPIDIQEKLATLASTTKLSELRRAREQLTDKYRKESVKGKKPITSLSEGITYAVSRMPATYAVISELLSCLSQQGYLLGIESVFDVGSGTGAGFLALEEFDENLQVTLFEKSDVMRDVFMRLFEGETEPVKFDLTCDNFSEKADLVVCSYVLNELSESDQASALENLLSMSKRYVLVIDAGTFSNYQRMMKLKEYGKNLGAAVVAPCMAEQCPLENDYCAFFARVERTSLMKNAKSGTKPYEDENYFYLLFDKLGKQTTVGATNRVIRRPVKIKNALELRVCSQAGIKNLRITRSNNQNFKELKKVRVNQTIKL